MASVLCDSSLGSSGSESVGDSSSLLAGRGIDTLGSVLIYSLPYGQLKVVSFYIMGSLGLSVLVDVVEALLQGGLIVELLLSESLEGLLIGADSFDVEWGLAVP